MIEQIINIINDGLTGIHKDQKVYGISQKIHRANNDAGIDYLPCIVDMDGEGAYIGIDDIQSMHSYHRINNANLTYSSRTPGYGDGRDSDDSFACSLIVAWDTRKVRLHNVDMAFLIKSRLPQMIGGIDGINTIVINPVGFIFNTKQVFDSEYSFDKNYLLPFFIQLIQLNYIVQFKYDQRCIDKCINCK